MRGTTNEEAFSALTWKANGCSRSRRATQMAQSRRKFEEAIKLDDCFARAYGYLSYVITRSVANGWLNADHMVAAEAHARKAVKLDPHDYAPYWDLGYCLLGQGKLKSGVDPIRSCLWTSTRTFTDQLDRKHGLLAEVAEAYVFDGRPEDAIKMLERAKRFPDWYTWNLGWAYYNARDYDCAIKELESMRSKPGDEGYVMEVQLMLAAAYAQKGNQTMAKNALTLFKVHQGQNTQSGVSGRPG